MTKPARAAKKEPSLTAVLTIRRTSDLPAPNEAQHQNDQDEEHGEHEQRDSRSMRDVTRQDADLEALKAQYRGGAHRAAHCQEIDDAEIGEGEHRAKDQADHNDGGDYRYDDLIVAPPEPSTVHRRGIEHVLGYRGDAREKNHDGEREKTPGIDEDDANHRQCLAFFPVPHRSEDNTSE